MFYLMQEVLRIVLWAVEGDAAEIGHEASLEERSFAAEPGWATQCYNDHLQYLSENPFFVRVEVCSGNPQVWAFGRCVMGTVEYIR